MHNLQILNIFINRIVHLLTYYATYSIIILGYSLVALDLVIYGGGLNNEYGRFVLRLRRVKYRI